jgi:hypothetical protein
MTRLPPLPAATEATATLIRVCRDESAPAAARTAAAERILAYSDGRPSASKHIAPQDIAAMSRAERGSLWQALFDTEEFPPFVQERIREAISLAVQQMTLPRPNRFTRGTPTPPPPHVPQPNKPARERATEAFCANSGDASGNARSKPSPLTGGSVDQRTGLPLRRIAVGDLDSINASKDEAGRIRSDIVQRSRPNGSNGLAHDAAFGSYYPWPRQ